MTTLSALSRAELGRRLRDGSIDLQTGAFVTRVHSPFASVADGLHLLYGDYPLLENNGFADFHVDVAPPPSLRRWYKPLARFVYDGMVPFLPLPAAQAFPMFEWGMNWCVSSRAHGYLILHAAVVEKHGRAAILPAPPGSGKSTLCAALVSRGWRLLSDELALVRPDDGLLAPLPRPISLKNASIEVMRHYQPDAVISRPVPDTTKGTVAHLKAPADSIVRAGELARPGWIVFPKYAAGAATTLLEVPAARAFMRVAENGFNYSVLGARGFATLGALVGQSRCIDFTYSALDEAVAVFEQLAGTP
ncbi:HprK-related kinase A [Massilia pseudoviolaceinigra]|uniref:HprK-related kinase A n=1 Tax=Massilia pseudoviolaceinigra TaxID=3057165 RepID=UPI0027968B1C|nr:HprK-related kinase A [Massilia sp. CCM 9206]MDQ1921947.1 HprK-related kinase A [Massilia sp. CCM 9206]